MPYSVRTLETEPFLEIKRLDDDGAPITVMDLVPPLGAQPLDFNYAETDDKVAILTHMRREATVGDPDNPPPESTVVLTSYDENYILFGGATAPQDSPQFYQRTAHSFSKAPLIFPLPTIPGDFYKLGASSHEENFFALVKNSSGTKVDLVQMMSDSWILVETMTMDEAVTSLRFIGSDILLVNGSTKSWLVDVMEVESVYAPTSRILDAAWSDEELWVALDTSPLISMTKIEMGVATDEGTLAGSTAASSPVVRRARFAPGGDTLLVTGSTTAAFMSYAYYAGSFKLVQSYGSSSLQSPRSSPFMSTDGSKAVVAGFESSNSTDTAHLLDRINMQVPVFDEGSLPTTLTNVWYGDVSQDGQWATITSSNTNICQIFNLQSGSWVLTQTLAFGVFGKFSPDGVYLVACGINAAPATTGGLRIFKRTAGVYAQVALLSGSGAVGFFGSGFGSAVSWTQDGLGILVQGNSTVPVAYTSRSSNTSDTFTQTAMTYPTQGGSQRCVVGSDTSGGTHFMFAALSASGAGTTVNMSYKTTPTGATVQTVNITGAGVPYDIAMDSTCTYCALSITNAPYLLIYKRTGSTWAQLTTGVPAPTGIIRKIAFSADTANLILAHDGSGATVEQWRRSGDTFTLLNTSPAMPGTVTYLGVSYDATVILNVVQGSPYGYIWGNYHLYDVQAYSFSHTYTSTVGTGMFFDAIRNDQLHGELGNGDGWHVNLSPPYDPVVALDFAPAVDAVEITNTIFSRNDNIRIYKNAGVWKVAVLEAEANVIITDLDGVFVTVYKKTDDETLEEVGYAGHDLGTDVRHMQWSPLGTAIGYHATNSDPDSVTKGRYIYGVTELLGLHLGSLYYSPEMLDSYIAWNPTQTQFVVTYSRTDASQNDVRLYNTINDGMESEEWDGELVAFGPCDYSACNQVIVAHGGALNPFSLFDVDVTGHTITYHPLPDFDWVHNTLILDVKFADCGNVVILTPDEVVDAGEQEDGDGAWGDNDSGDSGGGTNLGMGNTGVHVNGPHGHGTTVGHGHGGGGGGGGGGGYQGGLVPRLYIPYAAITVFHGY